MADLTAGYHADLNLDPDDIVRVTVTGQCTVQSLYGAPAGTTTLTNQTQDFGPYGAPAKLKVTAASGRTSYGNLRAPAFTDAEVASLKAMLAPGGPLDPAGNAFGLTEAQPVQTITATGTVHTGAGYFGGMKLRAVSGTATLTFYDALSATGTPIAVITAASLTGGDGSGYYPWAGNKLRPLTTGLYAVLSGGGTFTGDVLVSA